VVRGIFDVLTSGGHRERGSKYFTAIAPAGVVHTADADERFLFLEGKGKSTDVLSGGVACR
jgi:hypothetical protein